MKAATKTVTIDGIQIEIPVGSMDKPSERSEQIMRISQDPANWKLPVAAYHTFNRSEAEDLAYCHDWYCGGHEWSETKTDRGTLYGVASKGYYHYVGGRVR